MCFHLCSRVCVGRGGGFRLPKNIESKKIKIKKSLHSAQRTNQGFSVLCSAPELSWLLQSGTPASSQMISHPHPCQQHHSTRLFILTPALVHAQARPQHPQHIHGRRRGGLLPKPGRGGWLPSVRVLDWILLLPLAWLSSPGGAGGSLFVPFANLSYSRFLKQKDNPVETKSIHMNNGWIESRLPRD